MALQSSTNRLVRFLGIDVDPVNWGWLCDKGRFGFEAIESGQRLSAPLVREGEETPAGDFDVAYPLVVDDDGRPLRWLSGSRAEPLIELDDIVRDALSEMLEEETQYAPVVDVRGAVVGVLSVEIIGQALQ